MNEIDMDIHAWVPFFTGFVLIWAVFGGCAYFELYKSIKNKIIQRIVFIIICGPFAWSVIIFGRPTRAFSRWLRK